MAGNGALDLSIRIMGKVDPSLAKSISQVKGLTGSLTGGLRTTNSLASTVANTIGVIGKAGLGLAATLTGSVLVGMKRVTNEASKLEAQMAPVVRYVNGLADASGKVSDAIADNGKTFKQNYSDMENYIQRLSMDIPRTTEQLTTMSAALGQSGKDVTEQTQTGILRDTAVAATAMDLDDQTAGDYMAKWEASFTKRDADGNKVNYSHDDVMRLMNQINYLGANNATTAAEIASSVNKSASIGQLAGVDPSTTAAIATAMQATGVDTERTGTTISRIYTNISKGSSATKAQKEMWEELGFTAEGVAKSMQKDGTGTLMKVFGAVNQLPDERKIAALNTLFNQWAVEGSAKVTNNLDLLMKTLSEVSDEAAYANSMEREFAINTGTEESLRTMRDNAKTVLMQDLGEQLLPAQKELTRLQLDIYKGIDESLPDLSNLANSILPLLRTAVEGIGGAVQGALPWIQQGIDYLTDHGPEAAGAIGAILATLAAMSMAPTAYSAGSTALSVVKNLTLGGKASGAPGGKFGGITVGNLMGLQYPEIGKDGRMDGEQFRARRYRRAAEFFGRRRDRCFELGCVDEREEKADAGRCWENLRSGWLHQQCGEHSNQCNECHDRSSEPGGHSDGDHWKRPWCWRKGCLWQRRPEPDGRHWSCGWKAGRRIYVAAWNLRPGNYEPWNHGGGGISAGRPF